MAQEPEPTSQPAELGENPRLSHDPPEDSSQYMFMETSFVRKKHRTEYLVKHAFLLMALLMVLPLLAIVGYLFYKALPILSIDFLITNPIHGMRAGGIWSAFLGTIYLVIMSLCIAARGGIGSDLFK